MEKYSDMDIDRSRSQHASVAKLKTQADGGQQLRV